MPYCSASDVPNDEIASFHRGWPWRLAGMTLTGVFLVTISGCAGKTAQDAAPDGGSPGSSDADLPHSGTDKGDGGVTLRCPSQANPLAVNNVTKKVIPVYLAPADETSDVSQRRSQSLGRAFIGIHNYFADAMGTPYLKATFPVGAVQILKSQYTKSQWNDFSIHGLVKADGTHTDATGGCSMFYGAVLELQDHGLLTSVGLPPLGSADVKYYVVVGAGINGSCSSQPLSASEGKLLDELILRCPDGRRDECSGSCPAGTDPTLCGDDNACTPVGVIANQLARSFGALLSGDRVGADQTTCAGKTLVDSFWSYDVPGGFTLCEPDRHDLLGSNFFGPSQ
jgi:hypothetical protein